MKHLFKQKNINILFWSLIYTLPLLILLIQSINGSVTLLSVLNIVGINDNNIIVSVITNIFGSSGVIHLVADNSPIIIYLSYVVIMNIIHIAIDVLLLLPRIAQSFSDKICNSGDDDV